MEVGRLHMMPIPDPASACVVGDGGDVWDCEGFESAEVCGGGDCVGLWRAEA